MGSYFGISLSLSSSKANDKREIKIQQQHKNKIRLWQIFIRFQTMFASEADSPDELFDTIIHEIRHAADHIGKYYDLQARGEDSAYLQGEIAKKMFPAVSLVVCPMCHNKKGEEH